MSAPRGGGGLLALLVLAAAALLLFAAGPAAAQPAIIDYDVDKDGLIDVDSLAKLNALRWDLNGDGLVAPGDQTNYATAFPNPAAGMGCQATCAGYELTADLDFNTDTSTDNADGAVIDSSDAYWNGGSGWSPIGTWGNKFATTFDGGGHSISNLHINRGSTDYLGLFGIVGIATIRNLGLNDVKVVGKNYSGALAGALDRATVDAIYVTGSVRGASFTGGVIGEFYPNSRMRNVYNAASVTVTDSGSGGGGLVGYLPTITAAILIRDSYSFGVVSGADTGGLTSVHSFRATYPQTYWDTQASGRATNPSGGVGKTTSELKAPTSKTEDMDDATAGVQNIYSGWDAALWDFGTASQYPALKYDKDGDGTATWQEFGRQTRTAPVVDADYDVDNDGLIEVDSLAKLNALRWDLDGDGSAAASGDRAKYATAFPNPAAGMGCPATCTGYELEADLDFDQNNDDTITSVDADWWNGGSGWDSIGTDTSTSTSTRYNTVFAGNGHTISNLFINRGGESDVGLFGATGTGSEVRMVGLVDANVTGRDYVGGLVGSAYGDIRSAYTTGSVTGRFSVGGLAGMGTRNDIRLSYSNAAVTGSTNRAGGLAGYLVGSSVVAGYATGAVTTTGGQAGGLAGYLSGSSVVASYATGAVTGTASLGGLVGYRSGSGSATNSYWDTTTSGQANSAGGVGKATSDLQTPTAYGSGSDIYAAWNVDVDDADGDNSLTSGTDAPWDFGTANQYPALKADFDGDRTPTAYEFGRQGRSPPPPANEQPTFNEGATATRSVAENTATRQNIGAPVIATDADHPFGLLYTLSGTDASHFVLMSSGQLQTKDPLDFESKDSYEVIVNVYDGKNDAGNDDSWPGNITIDASITVTINVTDVDEPPPTPGQLNVVPDVGFFYFNWQPASASDMVGIPPVTAYEVQYRKRRSTGPDVWEDWTDQAHPVGAEQTSATIRDLIPGQTYGMRARAKNHEGESPWSLPATGVPNPYANTAPSFTEGATATRSVAENTAGGQDIGNPVAAADVNAGDTLTYSLRGTDASHFQLDTATGQLQTKGALDYEAKDSYQVTVWVTDGKDRNDANSNVIDDTITVTINVTDVNEPPTAAPSNVGVAPIPSGLEVTWTAPSAGVGRPPVSGYDVRYRRHSGGVGAWQYHNHRGAMPRARIRGLTPGSTYGLEVRAKNGEGESPWSSTASGQAGAALSNVDYDFDDDGLIEVDNLDQLDAIRYDPEGDGFVSVGVVVTAADKDAYELAFPGPALGMGCPAVDHDDDASTPAQLICTGYELNQDLDFNTDTFTDNDDGAVIDSSDAYWNGGLGWEPIRFYGTFEGNRYTISNLFINRPDRDEVGLFSRLGFPYTWRNQIYRVGLENVQVTGGERVGALAGEAHAFIHDSYSSGSVSGAGIVGGLLGKLTVGSVIVSSYSDTNVFGTLVDSRHAGGLVAWAGSDSIIYGSFATGQVSAPQANGGLVGSNFGNIIASYARGELDFGIGNQDPWDFDETFQANGVGGLVGNNWGRVITSYSTGGHPLYMKLSPMSYPIKGYPYYNPRIRLPDRSDFSSEAEWEKAVRETYDGGENNYRADYFWHIGGLVGDSALGTEIYSYWDVDTSDHPVSGIRDPEYLDWHRGEGLSTAELQSPTGYSGIYADWNVDIDGDGIADDPWDFGTGSQYPRLKADWDGDGTATSQEFDAQTTLQVTAKRDARAIGAVGIMVAVAENTAPGTDISDPFGSADPQTGDLVTYRLGGDDAGHFSIDSATGQLRTKGALDYEDKSSYSVTVIATDGDGQTTDIQVTIVVTDANQAPTFATATATVSVAENTAANTNIGSPLTATDAGDTLTYTLGTTADDGHFAIDSATGQLRTKGALDYEGKSSYSVTVTATDGGGLSASISVTITVTDVADTPPGQPAAPEIINVQETRFRITWTAPAAGSSAITGYGIQYKLTSAADAAYADVKPTPTGTGTGYNVVNRSGQTVAEGTSYDVRVRARNTEGWGPWSAAATVTTDGVAASPPGQAAAPEIINVKEISFRVTWTAPTAGSSPITGYGIQYKLASAAGSAYADVKPTPTGIGTGYNLVDRSGQTVAEGTSYAVRVRARNTEGWGPWSESAVAATAGAAPAPINQAPAFAAATATVSVAENTAANTNIGSPVKAADPDGDTLTYTLGTTADDGHFAVDSSTGQLQTKGALDYEGKASYSVTVTATDGGGLSASIAVTITVTDVADTPPGQPDAPEIINVKEISFRVTWTAPTAGSSPITGYGIQYKLTSAADSAYADVKPTPTGTGTGYTLVDRRGQSITAGTSYAVRVRASNAGGWGPWSDAAVATTAGPAPAPINQAPAFAAATATVSVAENTAANTNIGSPVKAADPDDGDTLIYSLGTTTDDGHFAIDSSTGQLQTKGALDYEGKASYSVTVTATDGGGLSASIGVTITVTDVADTPPGQPAAPEISNVKETSFRVTWTAPTVGSSAITGYGIQYKLTSAEDSAYADVKPTPTGIGTGYNLVDRNGQTVAKGTSYAVRVRASNAAGWGPWSEPAVAATAGAAPAPAEEESGEGGAKQESESGDYQAQAFYVESQGRVILQWDEVSKADHYTIEKNGQLLPGKILATSNFDDDVEKNTRYEYRITAYGGDGAVLATMTAATG